MKRLLVILLIAAAPALHSAEPTGLVIVWRKVATQATAGQAPGWVGYMKPVYDPISGTTLWYTNRDTSSVIYSTDMFSYKAASQTWTRLGGTGSTIATCGDGSTSKDISGNPITPWPSDRHPIQQLAVDTTRRRLYIEGGVCMNVTPNDTWFYSLNSAPTSNRWSKVPGTTVPSVQVSGSMEYSDRDDVIVLHGTDSGSWPRTWVFCPAGAGSLSAAQQSAGCVTADTWVETYRPSTVEPPQSYFGSLVYLPTTGKMLLFSHSAPRGEVWAYDVARRTWGNLNPAGQPVEPATSSAPERLVAYISSGLLAGRVLYHQTSHDSGALLGADWLYDPVANAWSSMAASGKGPQSLTYLAFDPSLGANGTIVAFSYDGGMWHGTIQQGNVTLPSAPTNLQIIRGEL